MHAEQTTSIFSQLQKYKIYFHCMAMSFVVIEVLFKQLYYFFLKLKRNCLLVKSVTKMSDPFTQRPIMVCLFHSLELNN